MLHQRLEHQRVIARTVRASRALRIKVHQLVGRSPEAEPKLGRAVAHFAVAGDQKLRHQDRPEVQRHAELIEAVDGHDDHQLGDVDQLKVGGQRVLAGERDVGGHVVGLVGQILDVVLDAGDGLGGAVLVDDGVIGGHRARHAEQHLLEDDRVAGNATANAESVRAAEGQHGHD